MPTAQSNVEKYLAVIAGHDEEIPTQPASRVEWYLNEILQNGGPGGGGDSLKVRIVSTLPATGVSGILYLVPSQQGSGQNLYDEYVWVEDETKFELLGQTGINVDLTDYAKKSEIPKNTSDLTNDSGFLTEHQSLTGYALKSEIPTKTSDLTNDSGFLTEHQSLTGYVTKTDQSVIDGVQNREIAALKSENAFLRELIRGVDTAIYRTASGNPATFSDGYDNAALKSCVVTITPTQDGTPSIETPVAIAGYDNVTVTRTGKNLLELDPSKITGSALYSYQSDGTFILNGEAAQTLFKELRPRGSFPLYLPKGDYILSGVENASGGSGTVTIYCYKVVDGKSTGATYRSIYNSDSSGGISFHSNGDYWSFNLSVSAGTYDNVRFTPMVRLASAPAGYEQYDGQSGTVSLSSAGTVYGGTLDVIAGTLTVTHGQIASYDGETVPDGWISSTGELSTGAQVVYPLDTPLSYRLTPVSLTSLSGYNNVIADAGTLAVTYRADTQITLS